MRCSTARRMPPPDEVAPPDEVGGARGSRTYSGTLRCHCHNSRGGGGGGSGGGARLRVRVRQQPLEDNTPATAAARVSQLLNTQLHTPHMSVSVSVESAESAGRSRRDTPQSQSLILSLISHSPEPQPQPEPQPAAVFCMLMCEREERMQRPLRRSAERVRDRGHSLRAIIDNSWTAKPETTCTHSYLRRP